MKKISMWLVAALLFTACQKDLSQEEMALASAAKADRSTTEKVIAPTCTESSSCNSLTKTLFAGQIIDVGNATSGGGFTITKNQDGTMTLKFKLSPSLNYGLDEVQVYIGDGSGLSNPGGDAPGQFPFSAHNLGGAKEATITLSSEQVAALSTYSNDGLGNICYVVAAHAAVSGGAGKETAWACGDRITESGNWSMKFNFCTVAECTSDIPPPQGACTLSQGYWFANTTTRGIVWNRTVLVGYPQQELQPLFPAKTNTLLKAVFQAAALELDVENTDDLAWSDVDVVTKDAYDKTMAYLSSKGLTTVAALSAYKPNAVDLKSLQAWAGTISNFIKNNHCGNVFDPNTALVAL